MTEVAFWIDVESGEMLGAQQVRRLAGKSKPEGNHFIATALGRNPQQWKEPTLRRHGIAPVYKTDTPQVDDRLQTIDGRHYEWTGERYEQRWQVHDKFASTDEIRQHMQRQLDDVAKRKRDAGINVNGIPVKTDADGVAWITGAKTSSRDSRVYPLGGGESVMLDRADIDGIFEAVDAHITAVDDRHAQLMSEIAASSDPINVDIESGWPV